MYQSFECQLLSLSIAGRKSADNFAVAVVYRPPSSSVVEFYDDLSDMFDKFGDAVDADKFVACSDLNCRGDNPSSVSSELQAILDT